MLQFEINSTSQFQSNQFHSTVSRDIFALSAIGLLFLIALSTKREPARQYNDRIYLHTHFVSRPRHGDVRLEICDMDRQRERSMSLVLSTQSNIIVNMFRDRSDRLSQSKNTNRTVRTGPQNRGGKNPRFAQSLARHLRVVFDNHARFNAHNPVLYSVVYSVYIHIIP